MISTEIVTKNYFSKSAGLTLWPVKSTRAIVDGSSQTIDGSPIEFQNMGNGWGKYSTSDPMEIEFLDARCKRPGDIVTLERYLELTTPPEAKLAQANREISSQNRIIADMQAQLEKLQGGASSRK